MCPRKEHEHRDDSGTSRRRGRSTAKHFIRKCFPFMLQIRMPYESVILQHLQGVCYDNAERLHDLQLLHHARMIISYFTLRCKAAPVCEQGGVD